MDSSSAASSAQAGRDGSQPCRVATCQDTLFFVGQPPGGWSGALELTLCFGARCATASLDLSELQRAKSYEHAGGGTHLFALVLEPGCDLDKILGHRNAHAARELMLNAPAGEPRLIVGTSATSTKRKGESVSLTLRRPNQPVVATQETVAFDGSGRLQSCHHPNGKHCPPECCDAFVEF